MWLAIALFYNVLYLIVLYTFNPIFIYLHLVYVYLIYFLNHCIVHSTILPLAIHPCLITVLIHSKVAGSDPLKAQVRLCTSISKIFNCILFLYLFYSKFFTHIHDIIKWILWETALCKDSNTYIYYIYEGNSECF